MKKIITGGAIALALTGGAADAQAFDWYVSENNSVRASLGAASCLSPDHVDVQIPASAHNPEAMTPLPGQKISAESRGTGHEYGPVQVTGVANLGSAVRFIVQPVGGWCAPTTRRYEEGDPYMAELGADTGYYWTDVDEGWQAEWRKKFTIRYQVRKRIVMTRNLARNLTEEALYRRFSWFGDANHGGYRCRISGNRGRCRHVFVIGDGAVIGVVRMRLVGRNGQKPLWNYRLNALQIDEYCRYVTHAGNCTKRIKKQRNRVSLPYWVRAKNA